MQLVSEMTALATGRDSENEVYQTALEEAERDVHALQKHTASLKAQKDELRIKLMHEKTAFDSLARRLHAELKKNEDLVQQVTQLTSAAEETSQRMFFLQCNSALLQQSEKELLSEQERNKLLVERIAQLEAELNKQLVHRSQQTDVLPLDDVVQQRTTAARIIPRSGGVKKVASHKPPRCMVGHSYVVVGKSYAAKLVCSPGEFAVVPCWDTHAELVKCGTFPFLASVSEDAYVSNFRGATKLKPREFECLSGFGLKARRWRESCRIVQGTDLVHVRSIAGSAE